jgi:hypothetical protein
MKTDPLAGTFQFAYHLIETVYQIFVHINFEDIDFDMNEYFVSILDKFMTYRQELDKLKMNPDSEPDHVVLEKMIELINNDILDYRNSSIGAIYQQEDLSVIKFCPDLLSDGQDYELTNIDFTGLDKEISQKLLKIQKKYVDTTTKMSFLIITSLCKHKKKLKQAASIPAPEPKKSKKKK